MAFTKGGNWRSLMEIFHGRRATQLLALLLITVSLLTYFLHNSVQADTFTYPNTSDSEGQPQQAVDSSITSDVVGSASNELLANDLIHNSSELTTTPALSLPILDAQGPLAGGIPLRVMCLGASVARGAVSIGNLGFRSPLRNKLAALGNPINFVGSQRLGAFKDNDLEAYAGGRIDQIHAHAEKIVPQLRPNVFVIHVGSNDCLQKHDTANAYERYRDFVLYLLTTSTRATVIISTLLTNTVLSQEPCILDVNIQIRRVASELQRQGRRVVFAEMHCEQGYPDRPVVADISPDGTHPFDHGYELMADIFFEAFLQADKRGFLQTPEQNGIPEDGELERSHEPELFEPPPPKKPKPAPQQAQTAENKNKVKDGDNGKTDTTADTKAEDTKDKATVVADDKVLPATGTVTDTQTGVAGDIETTTTAETKATPVAGLVVGDNGDLVYNGEKVGIVVEGDAEKLKGMGADEEGNILDSAGNKVGFAVPLDAVLDPVSGAIDNKGTATDTQIDPKPVADNTAATPLEVKTNDRIENNLPKTI